MTIENGLFEAWKESKLHRQKKRPPRPQQPQPETPQTRERKYIHVFPDGACFPNPGAGGWAYVIVRPDGTVTEDSGSVEQTTNNRMELLAVIMALRKLNNQNPIMVEADSQYVIKGASSWMHNWKAHDWKRKQDKQWVEVKNADLWQDLDAACKHKTIRWAWIKGHNNHPYNERADQLATLRTGATPEEVKEHTMGFWQTVYSEA